MPITTEVSPDDENSKNEPETGLKKWWVTDSPHNLHFKKVFDEHAKMSEAMKTQTNELFAPTVVKYLVRRLLSIAFLWTGIGNQGLYYTNGDVENWFKIVKEDILQKQPKLRPGIFVRELSASGFERTRKYQLQKEAGMHFQNFLK